MKSLLTVSLVLIVIASFLVFAHPQKAEAVPISYNITSFTVTFTNYTRASVTNFDIMVDSGYNGTVNSLYQGRSTNNTINWEFGYHPTLPRTLDTTNNITASASVAATQSLPITIASGHNNVALVVGIVFEHTTDTDHNKARMSSVIIGGFPMSLLINKTVTCGAAACDSEIWALGNNTALTGAQTITITPADVTNYHMVAGVYSVYNVRSIRPVDAVSSATGTSITPSVTVNNNFAQGYVLDNMLTLQTGAPSANNQVKRWVGHTSILTGASQFNIEGGVATNPILSWTTTNVQWINVGVEVIPIQDQTHFAFNTAWPVTSTLKNMVSNGSKIYYIGDQVGKTVLQHIDVLTGVETHDYTNIASGSFCTVGSSGTPRIFVTQKYVNTYCLIVATLWKTNIIGGNTSLGTPTFSFISDETIKFSSNGDVFSSNTTTTLDSRVTSSDQCDLTFIPSNTTTPIDDIACDSVIPNHVGRFWNGMYIYKIGNYYSNSTLNFFGTIDASNYKKHLSIPASVYGLTNPDVKIIGHWGGNDYLLSVNSATIQYVKMSTLTTLLNMNRAFQTYDLTLPLTDNKFFLSPSSINPSQNIKLYGQNGLFLNTTVAKYGMIGLPSGYSMRTTATSESVIRTIDPRWTNTPATDIPAITTTSSLFPIVLTVGDAPTDGALWLSNGAQVINSVNSAWCITTLDTTHTAECDIPANQCANAYVADISVTPTVWNYEGYVCATGASAKTIYYTNTTPLTFYSMPYGASSSYTAATNGLTVTTRASTTPYTYTVVIKNSTGSTTQTFSATINATSATHAFNVTNATKPASVSVSFTGAGVVYTAYMGSSLSLASVASFFHTYFSYQGFDLLSFIPIIFASMFTRNVAGIGGALTVVLIATLSWLSIVVIPDTSIYIMIFIAVISMIGYRSIYG